MRGIGISIPAMHASTAWFHLVTLHELHKQRANKELDVVRIVPEQAVLLEPLHGQSVRGGRFDFLVVRKNGRTMGIEVLCRPTEGKMKQKLSYAKEVDEFVFVLPHSSFELYRKKNNHGFRVQGRKKAFDRLFASPTIKAWLLDPRQGFIVEKNVFSKVFETEK